MEKKTIKVTLVKSPIGCKKAHRQTVLGLGLKKIRQTRELEDTPAVRGMINTVSYLCIVVCRSAASHPGHMNSSLKFA